MHKRPFHFLKGNKGNARPQHVIFFDTETKPVKLSETEDKHILKVGWACYIRKDDVQHSYQKQWIRFTTPEHFWTFVESFMYDKTRIYLVAHNIAFDFRIVKGFEHAEKREWEQKFLYDKGTTTLLRFKTARASLELLSSTNYFAMTLKALGDMVGLPKKEIDFNTTDIDTLSDYCKRDVEIVIRAWEMWLAFIDKHDFGSFKRTLPSQAFAAYRHRFMNTPIAIHGDMEACKLERLSYKGGRTECFRVGTFEDGPYFYVDVNGMYAHQMLEQKYPFSLCGMKQGLALRSVANKLRNFAVVARVILDTDIPAFVVKHDDRNVYPVGRFETFLTTPEIKFAMQHGFVKEVGDIAWYKQGYIFREYVDYITDLKQRYELEENGAFRGIAKLYVNALYGKFGQTAIEDKKEQKPNPNAVLVIEKRNILKELFSKSRSQHYITRHGEFNRDTGRWHRPPGWKQIETHRKTPEESYNSFPAVVAHVTAYARMYLWKLITLAGRVNTYYADTDSLIVNQAGLDNLRHLLDDHKLGYLKIEKQGETVTIHSPKDYAIGDRIRRKGIRKNALQVGKALFLQDQFLGLRGAIRRETPDLVTIKKVTKNLYREIKTGVVQDNGSILPFRFPL